MAPGLLQVVPRECWTVVLSRVLYQPHSPETDTEMPRRETGHFRYAFLRPAAAQTIPTNPPPQASGSGELEVVRLEGFLRVTGALSETDAGAVDRRQADFCRVADGIGPHQLAPLPFPRGAERLAVMDHGEAAEALLGCLAGPDGVRDVIYVDMEEMAEGRGYGPIASPADSIDECIVREMGGTDIEEDVRARIWEVWRRFGAQEGSPNW